MGLFLWSLLLSFQALPLSSAQSYTPLPQTSCLNPAAITATGYGKCESVVSEFAKCNSTARTEKAAAATCICRQEMLNGVFDCENEFRFCGGMNSGPYMFDLADSWHSACNSRITFTPTTPVLSTYSSIDIDACSSAWDGCVSQSAEASKCLGYTTKESELQSCMCQPQMLSAAFTCNYYANVSCELTPGTLSEVLGYSYCSNFMAVLGPLVNTTPTGSRPPLSTLSASLTVSKPALPGTPQTSAGPLATKTPSSAMTIAPANRLLIELFLGALAWL